MLRRALVAYLYIVFVGYASGDSASNFNECKVYELLGSEKLEVLYPFQDDPDTRTVDNDGYNLELQRNSNSNHWPHLMIKTDCRYEYRIQWSNHKPDYVYAMSFARHQPPSNFTCHDTTRCTFQALMASFRDDAPLGENAAMIRACNEVAARTGRRLTVKAACDSGDSVSCDMRSLLEHPEPAAGFLGPCLQVADAIDAQACSTP